PKQQIASHGSVPSSWFRAELTSAIKSSSVRDPLDAQAARGTNGRAGALFYVVREECLLTTTPTNERVANEPESEPRSESEPGPEPKSETRSAAEPQARSAAAGPAKAAAPGPGRPAASRQ